mgnify:CR=1 FL=1
MDKPREASRYSLNFTLLLTNVAGTATAADKPLKVFILAGQSNMQGHANVSTFDDIANDPGRGQKW